MKKTLIALMLAATLVLSGCMGLGITKPDIALTTYNTDITNGSINAKYLDGLKVFSEDTLICYFENTDPAEFEENLATIAKENHNVILTTQYLGWSALEKVAKTAPDKLFGITDAPVSELPENIFSISYKYYEGAYLAGYVAGKTISGNKLGILCEQEDELNKSIAYAFMAGAIKAGGNITFEEKYIGITYDNNVSRNAAAELYSNGCEIVFQNLINPTGAINAAETEDKFIIGLGLDQSVKSASHVLTTVVVNYDIALSTVIRKYMDKENIGGKTFNFGVSDYVISLSKTTTNIDKDVLKQTNKEKESIISGELKVPHTAEAVEELRQEAIKNPVTKTPPENNTPKAE